MGNFSGRSSGGRGYQGREGKQGGQNFGPREMHDATCSGCGQQCQVPFKPTSGKPVYCRTCYADRR